jgi:hypothetical protein
MWDTWQEAWKEQFCTSLFSGINKLNKKNRFALDIKARCVAELYQSFQVHNGELYKIKEQMPCIIETILMCYKGYCGYSCKVNSFVCAGLPHNHWQKSYIARGETFKMTCDDADKIEKCIKIFLSPQSLKMVQFLTLTQKSEAVNRSHRRCNPFTKLCWSCTHFSPYAESWICQFCPACHSESRCWGNSWFFC